MATRIVGLALSLVLVHGGLWAADARGPGKLYIRLHAIAGVQTAMADRGRSRFESILARAGIGIEWRDCRASARESPICNAAPEPNEAVVRLLAGPPPLSAEACGVTLVPKDSPPHYVSIFVDCVRRAAEALSVREDIVFAAILAHEIGHLLLGPGHGPVGLMQAQPGWTDWQRGIHEGLTFTPMEAEQLRRHLLERSLPL